MDEQHLDQMGAPPASLEEAGGLSQADLALLVRASETLAASLDYQSTLQAVATMAVPRLGDWCFVDVLDDEGSFQRLGVAHVDPGRADLAARFRRSYPVQSEIDIGVSYVLARGEPQVIFPVEDDLLRRIARDDAHLAVVQEWAPRSMLVVPLLARGRTLGALTVARTQEARPYLAEDLRLAMQFGHRAALAVDNARLFAEAQRAEERARFLAEASRVLSASLAVVPTLQTVARLAVPTMADTAGVYLVEPDGSISQAAAAHVDPVMESLIWELHEQLPLHLDHDRLLANVIRTGQPQMLRDIPPATFQGWQVSSRAEEIVAMLQLRSYMAVPLKVRGGWVRGALAFSSSVSERRFGAADLGLAEELARRVAATLENAHLYEVSQAAHDRAVFLARVSEDFASSLDYETTLGKIAGKLVPTLADWAIIDVVEGGGLRRVAIKAADPAIARVLEEVQRRYPPDRSSPQPAAQALRAGATIRFSELPDDKLAATCRDAHHFALMKQIAPRSAIAVPMLSRGQQLGAITLAWSHEGRRFSEADVQLAEDVAQRAALAIENARLLQEAREASRLKDDFLATVGHELRTPLTAIIGWTRLLRTGRLADDKRLRALDSIQRSAETQSRLVDDILDISRIITGRLQLDTKAVDLADILGSALESARLAADAKGVELWLETHDDVGLVIGDADRLRQVVWNLLSNAVKFTPNGGRVEATLRRLDRDVAITVRDTGQGIHPAFLPHVFERFRQADSSTTRRHGGLGLGLAIVRHLVELHGGTVEASSDGEGRGATFSVRIPVASVPAAIENDGRSAPETAAASLMGLAVLVVEDEAEAREVVAATLENAGARVEAAASAAEALAAIRSRRPDILVSDIAMPGEDGYSLIRRIRAQETQHRLPALAVSAYARPEDRANAVAAGFDAYLTKPVDAGRLLQLVTDLTASNGLRTPSRS